MRHGPHQGAQKSTRTGTEESSSSSNVAGPASTIHGSRVWQTLQRGTPDGLGRIRFLVPQLGQVMIVLCCGITFLPGRGAPAHDAVIAHQAHQGFAVH
jgi:hypothetical protein